MTTTMRKRVLMAGTIIAALVAGACSKDGEGRSRVEDLNRETAEVAALSREIAALRADIRGQAIALRATVAAQGRQLADYTRLAGGCTNPCAEDTDADGLSDCEDPCPCDFANADGDADLHPDCLDPCPDDATNACIDPCRADSDGDGVGDCSDPCAYDPKAPYDDDNDGVFDCGDPCPDDPTNNCADRCVLDQDGDGTPDCRDSCLWGGQDADGAETTILPNICLPFPVPLPPRRPDFCGIDSGGPCETDADCLGSGCSGQVCQSRHEDPWITTCEWRDCYDAQAAGVSCGCVAGRCQWLPSGATG